MNTAVLIENLTFKYDIDEVLRTLIWIFPKAALCY